MQEGKEKSISSSSHHSLSRQGRPAVGRVWSDRRWLPAILHRSARRVGRQHPESSWSSTAASWPTLDSQLPCSAISFPNYPGSQGSSTAAQPSGHSRASLGPSSTHRDLRRPQPGSGVQDSVPATTTTTTTTRRLQSTQQQSLRERRRRNASAVQSLPPAYPILAGTRTRKSANMVSLLLTWRVCETRRDRNLIASVP